MAKIKTVAELHQMAQQLQMQAFQPFGTFSTPKDEIVNLLPADLAWDYDMAIIGSNGRAITIAIDDPENSHKEEVSDFIREAKYVAVFYLTTSDDLTNILKVVHPHEEVELKP